MADGSDLAGSWEVARWVLVVDPDPDRRRAVVSVVEEARMLAVAAGDVEAAHRLLSREQIEFALVAEELVPDGWARLWPRLHPRKAILVSRGEGDDVPAGFETRVRWPFDARQLLAALAVWQEPPRD